MNLKRTPQLGVPAVTSANIEGGGFTLVVDLDREQYLYGVDVSFIGRLTTAGGAAASINAEAPQSIIQRARVTYNHEKYGSKGPINLSGASLFRRAHIQAGTAPLLVNGGLAVANAPYDMIVHYPIIFPVENLGDLETQAQLLDAPHCGSLRLELDLSPGAALAPTGGATTYTWANFGGGGNPQFLVNLIQPNGYKGAPYTARVEKYDRNDSLAAAIALGNQVGNELVLGGALCHLYLKQYVQDALQAVDIAATMNTPNLTTAVGLSRPQFQIDRKAIRDYSVWRQLEMENKVDYETETWPTGYGVIAMVEGALGKTGKMADALDTRLLQLQKRIVSVGGLNNALASGRLEIGWTQVFGVPGA